MAPRVVPINRVKMMYNGTGPRIPGEENKIWPRDAIKPEAECDKILYRSLRDSLTEQQVTKIKGLLLPLYTRLRDLNIQSLFNKHCKLDHGFFDQVNLEIPHALEAYTCYDKVLGFVHGVMVSLDQGHRLRSRMFGCNNNYNIFRRNIKWLVVGTTKLRKLDIVTHIVLPTKRAMDLQTLDYLQGLPESIRAEVFVQVVASVTRYLYNLLRRYFYITTGNPFMFKTIYYRYDIWQKIQARQVNAYVNTGLLERCLFDENIRMPPPEEISRMKFHVKKDGLRMICTRQLTRSYITRKFQKHSLYNFLSENVRDYTKFNLGDMLQTLRFFRDEKLNGKSVYFVRADIKNCFPSILQEKLRSILTELLDEHFVGDHVQFDHISYVGRAHVGHKSMPRVRSEWTVHHPKLSARPQREGQVVVESQQIAKDEIKDEWFRPYIINPVLRESKDSKLYYNLCAGLRQGAKFSTVLSSIYIQTAINQHLGDFLDERNDCRILRYVDDILFMSTNLSKAEDFMSRMLRGFPDFNLKMNINKLQCNFEFNQGALCRVDNNYIVFYNREIDLFTLQCAQHYDLGGLSIYYAFHAVPYDTERNMLSVCNWSNLDYCNLDFNLNGSRRVMRNVFEHGCFLAHKLATLVLISLHARSVDEQQARLLRSCATTIAAKIVKHMSPGKLAQLDRQVSFGFRASEVELIVAASFLCTWGRSRLRHRSGERATLRAHYRDCKAAYLVKGRGSAQSECEWVRRDAFMAQLESLRGAFKSSRFVRQVMLPDKF